MVNGNIWHLKEMLQVTNKMLRQALVWKQSSVSLKIPLGNPTAVCESQCNPVQEVFFGLCVNVQAPTSPGSAFNSRDHRQGMKRSEQDKRACEGLKVHKTFLLWFFSRNRGNICTRQGHSEVQILNFTKPKENSNGWDVPRKTFYMNVAR